MRLAFETVKLELRAPLRTAWGELRSRELVRVRLEAAGDDWGEGEAAPLEPYDGVPIAAVLAALDAYAAVLGDAAPGTPHEELLARCAAERELPQALAAIDLALWDRASLRSGRRVADLLVEANGAGPRGASAAAVPVNATVGAEDRAGAAAAAVPVNATVGAEDRSGAAAAAARAAADGFRCVKVKVGIGDDAGRLAAVRAAVGPGVALRTDANGAWESTGEALANLRALAPTGLELCEEPVHGVEALRELRAESPVPVAMDETAAEPGAAGSGAADAVCLKVARCGGLSRLMRAAAAARAAGSAVYVSSSFDGPLGIAAGVHAAAAVMASGPVAPCGLATLAAFADERARPAPLLPARGEIAVPSGPGLLSA